MNRNTRITLLVALLITILTVSANAEATPSLSSDLNGIKIEVAASEIPSGARLYCEELDNSKAVKDEVQNSINEYLRDYKPDGSGQLAIDRYAELKASVTNIRAIDVEIEDAEGNHLDESGEIEYRVSADSLSHSSGTDLDVTEIVFLNDQLSDARIIEPDKNDDGTISFTENSTGVIALASVHIQDNTLYQPVIDAHTKIRELMDSYPAIEKYKQQIDYGYTDAQKAELKNVSDQVTAGCDTDYKKIEAVYKYVADRIIYEKEYHGSDDPYAAWRDKMSVCAGYASLSKWLLNDAGIACVYVTNTDHAFNAAYDSQNKRWVFFDSTWGSENADSQYNGYNMSYFDISINKISALNSHEIFSVYIYQEDQDMYYRLTTTGDDSWFNQQQWALHYAGLGNKDVESLVIGNAELGGIPVTSIDISSFKGSTRLKKVIIGQGITEIDEGAFRDCNSLEEIQFPSSLKKIGNHAFSNCSSLKDINIPEGIKTIEDGLFSGCVKLTGINLHNNITSIGRYAFRGCSGLKTITLPGSVKKIGDMAFSECTQLEKVSIPNGVKKIDYATFYGCSNLTDVSIPSTVTSIGNQAFEYCKKLQHIDLPASITEIGDSAFANCTGLSRFVVPDGVAALNYGVFAECGGLNFITIPSSVKTIGNVTFIGCDALKDVDYKGTKEEWKSITVGVSNYPLNMATVHYKKCESGHILSHQAGKPVKCVEDGIVENWYCSRCNRYFSNQQCSNEIYGGVVIRCSGHKWSNSFTIDYPPASNSEGAMSKHCTVCGMMNAETLTIIPALGGGGQYSVADIPTLGITVKISKPKRAKGAVTVKWKKASKSKMKKISGYEIEVSEIPDFQSARYVRAGKKASSKKVKYLAKKTLYYVRIRAYCGDSYGPWSKVKTVRTK